MNESDSETPMTTSASGSAISQQPNSFVLTGHGTHVSYQATGITGIPSLTYQDRQLSKTFTGSEIRSVTDEASELVSVSIRISVDTGYTSFTLFVPRVNLVNGQAAHVTTLGIVGVHRLTIDTPAIGQLDTYHSLTLSGTASLIETLSNG